MTWSLEEYGLTGKEKVVVLAGGEFEREVSLKSAEVVMAALQEAGFTNVHLLDAVDDWIQKLITLSPDRVFNILHGGPGENGEVQSVIKQLGFMVTGSSPSACAFAMDKNVTKEIWRAIDLPVLPSLIVESDQVDVALPEGWKFPLAVKPCSGGGSSLGVSCVEKEEELAHAIAKAKEYDSRVLIEPWILGTELTVGILGDEALPVIAVHPGEEFYDYEAKYLANDTEYDFNTGLLPEQDELIQAICLFAFQALGCQGWGRLDLMLDQNNEFYLLEMNPNPGMTTHSLVPKAARRIGIELPELVTKILSLAK